MCNVHRFHSDLLMNVKGLREYLSQTAPVAYGLNEFPFATRIEQHLAEVCGYRSYDVVLNGVPVVRPYRKEVAARDGFEDRVRDIELLECVSGRGQLLCRGWFAQTGFLSALPPHITMRGIRVRHGNIAVGDEYFLKDLFSENRFATWHIGELHVTPLLKLNARRDGFEESAEYEDFLEWASMLCRRLGGLCRQSSKDRSLQQCVERLRKELEVQLAIPFFVDEVHARLHLEDIGRQLMWLRRLLADSSSDEQRIVEPLATRFLMLTERPVYLRNIVDGRALRGKDNRQLLVDFCKRLLSVNNGNGAWAALLDVVQPYLRPG